jgi:hypothetical protein
LMGCESMDDTGLADEVLNLGASAVGGPVSIDKSDEATLRLLGHWYRAHRSGRPLK